MNKDEESQRKKKVEQHQAYQSGATEGKTVESIRLVERIVKNCIYPKLKFISDDDSVFDMPDFTGLGPKTQAVAVCERILSELNRSTNSIKKKVMWWISYKRVIRRKIIRLRLADVQGIKKAFREGNSNHNLQFMSIEQFVF